MRRFVIALIALTASGCATPSHGMNWDCVPDNELRAAAYGGATWRAIPTPESANVLIALRNPSRAGRQLRWFEASDGRVSACVADRYGSSFVIYSDSTPSASVIDEGDVIILFH